MSLIVVKEIGYGLKGDKLDLTIAVPKDSYLDSFYVSSQKDIKEKCTSIYALGIDYIEAVQNTDPSLTKQGAFNEMFTKLCEYKDPTTGNIYDIYQLKSDFMWFVDGETKGLGVSVSQEDLTLVTMHLNPAITTSFTYSTECGEDSTTLTVPLCDMLHLRLKALDTIAGADMSCSCELPRAFIDKLLQLRVVELAICCKDYCTALTYWSKFYGDNAVKPRKSCGCNG